MFGVPSSLMTQTWFPPPLAFRTLSSLTCTMSSLNHLQIIRRNMSNQWKCDCIIQICFNHHPHPVVSPSPSRALTSLYTCSPCSSYLLFSGCSWIHWPSSCSSTSTPGSLMDSATISWISWFFFFSSCGLACSVSWLSSSWLVGLGHRIIRYGMPFAFAQNVLGRANFALKNPPFCGDNFLTNTR